MCVRALEDDEEEAIQRAALVVKASDHHQQQHRQRRLKDLVDGAGTLGFHLQPKVLPPSFYIHAWLISCNTACLSFPDDRRCMQTVELRVSMHCNGCARKVHKHISKMEGTYSSIYRNISLDRSSTAMQVCLH